MLVKEDGDLEYSHLAFGGIQGFDYVRGHEYELEVRKTTLANPPADGSNIAYELLKIINDIPLLLQNRKNCPKKLNLNSKWCNLFHLWIWIPR